MALEGGARVIKFLVVFFNFIFFVFGGLLIGIGAWTLIKFGDYVTLTDDLPYATGSKVMIAAGVLVAVISFMGCCGAWKENRCMLVIFFICLLVILGLEIAAAALGYQHRNEVDEKVDDSIIKEVREHFGEEGSEGTTDGFNKLQETEECCGWLNYTEWWQAKVFDGKHWVPDSCCKEKKDKCGQTQNTAVFYTEPCKGKLRTLLKDKLYYVGAVGITVIVIQVLGMIFALILIVQIGKSGTYA